MSNRLLTLVMVGWVLAGCSGEEAGGGDTQAVVQAPVASAAEPVAAVLQSGGTPIAKLGFVLEARPVSGAPMQLRLELTSAAGVPGLQIRVEAPAFHIDPATAQASLAVEADKIASHLVRLTPQREGLAEVSVRLRGEADAAESVYVIPVLVAAAAAAGG